MSLTLNPLPTQALNQARAMVGNLNPRQRFVIGGGVLLVVAAIVAMVHFMTPAGDSVLYSGLQPADAQQVTAALSGLNIPYTVSTDGASVSVPSPQLDRARLQLAAQGLPHTGQLGFELFDKTNWSGSDFDQQVNYQRALEGELERTIETINGVRSASVQLTPAHDSLFTSDDRPAKAAVVLTLAGGGLDANMANAIRHLVASAVDNLQPGDVAIMDANGNLAPGGQGPGGLPAQSELENQLTAKLLATLAPVVGAAHVRASVTVQYDPTSGDATEETYDPKGSVVLSDQRSSSGASGLQAAGGVPGTTSNLPSVQAPGTNVNSQLGLSSGGGQQSDSATYAVSRTVRHDIRPAGTIQRLSAAVVVDDVHTTVQQNGHAVTEATARSPQELQQLQSLAAAAIGIDPTRGDVLTVTNLPFITPPAPPPPPAPAPQSLWQRLPAPWIAAAAALLLLLLLVGVGAMVMLRKRDARQQPAQANAAPVLTQPATVPTLAQPVEAELAVHEERRISPAQFINVTELLTTHPDDAPPEVQRVLEMKERVSDRVRREPGVAGRLVQGWMNRQPEGGE